MADEEKNNGTIGGKHLRRTSRLQNVLSGKGEIAPDGVLAAPILPNAVREARQSLRLALNNQLIQSPKALDPSSEGKLDSNHHHQRAASKMNNSRGETYDDDADGHDDNNGDDRAAAKKEEKEPINMNPSPSPKQLPKPKAASPSATSSSSPLAPAAVSPSSSPMASATDLAMRARSKSGARSPVARSPVKHISPSGGQVRPCQPSPIQGSRDGEEERKEIYHANLPPPPLPSPSNPQREQREPSLPSPPPLACNDEERERGTSILPPPPPPPPPSAAATTSTKEAPEGLVSKFKNPLNVPRLAMDEVPVFKASNDDIGAGKPARPPFVRQPSTQSQIAEIKQARKNGELIRALGFAGEEGEVGESIEKNRSTAIARQPSTVKRLQVHLHSTTRKVSDLSSKLEGCRVYCLGLAHLYQHSSLVTRCGFAYGALAMVVELYPISPTYNSTLALACLYITQHLDDFGESFFRAFMLMLSISAIIDFSWVIKVSTGTFMVPFKIICIILVIINIFLKYVMCVKSLTTTTHGSSALKYVNAHLKLLFPPLLGPPRKRLFEENIVPRVIALTWMHALTGLAYFMIFLVIACYYNNALEFDTTLLSLPLSAILVLKAFGSFFVSAALFRNIQLTPCLGTFGCLSCCYEWAMLKDASRKRRHNVQFPAVLITGSWAKTILLFKGVDVAMACWVWALFFLHWDELIMTSQYSIRQICLAIFILSILSDAYTLVLGLSIAWLVSVYRFRKELNAEEYGEDDGKKQQSASARLPETAASVWQALLSTGRRRGRSLDSMSSIDGEDARRIDINHIGPTTFQPTQDPYDSPRRQAVGVSDKYQVDEEGRYAEEGEAPPIMFLDAFEFSPDDFQDHWDHLLPALSFQCYVEHVPSIEEVREHLETSIFFVIASGVTGSLTKVYACARGAEQLPDGQSVDISFLAELVFDGEERTLMGNFKCSNPKQAPYFIENLALADIVEDYTPCP